MTETELRAAAMGIITYVSIVQTGHPPDEVDEDGFIEVAACLNDIAFERALEICADADMSAAELFTESEDDEDD